MGVTKDEIKKQKAIHDEKVEQHETRERKE